MTRSLAKVVAAAVWSVVVAVAIPYAQNGSSTAVAFEVAEKSIPELQDALTARRVTSKQLVAAYLARIAAYDQQGPRLNAMVVVNPHALEAAQALDEERAAGRVRGPLHGIPVLIKDNYETADLPTTGGSIALAGFMPGRDAFQVQKLREAGAVIVGKTNLHELALGITTISSIAGQTRNPYDLARNPGGSSGGTGAAVAASFGAAGMGSDTCGSIRIPSANNNLVGLRPTSGLSSRRGIIPLSHTQDTGGPLARSVIDLALMLDATVAGDPEDESTLAGDEHRPASFRSALDPNVLGGVRIGVVNRLFGAAPEDKEGGDVVRTALDTMRERGATVVDAPMNGLEDALQGASVLTSEFKFDLIDYLARYPNAPVHSLAEILERGEYHAALEAGFKRSEAVETRETEAYRAARQKRDALRRFVAAALEEQKLDALAYPVLSRKPALIGEPVRGMNNCQVSANSGLPAISIPAGFTPDGLPIGLELLGPAWTDARLVSIAYAYEQAVHPRKAPWSTPPLADAKPPAMHRTAIALAGIHATFALDSTTGRLSYDVTSIESSAGRLSAAIHRGSDGQNGPVIATIVSGRSGEPRAGELMLSREDRDAAQSGALYLTVRSSAGAARHQLFER
jgi:amidase